jgi:hypothetical protein
MSSCDENVLLLVEWRTQSIQLAIHDDPREFVVLWIVRCGLYGVDRTVWFVRCGLYGVDCRVWIVRCALPYVMFVFMIKM